MYKNEVFSPPNVKAPLGANAFYLSKSLPIDVIPAKAGIQMPR